MLRIFIVFCFLLLVDAHSSVFASENKIYSDSYFDSLESTISTGGESVHDAFRQQIAFFESNGDSLNTARFSYLLGKYYILNSFNYPLAFNYLFRAMTNFERFNNLKASGKCEMQVGLIYYLQRNFDEAQNYFEMAYNKMIKTEDSTRIGRLAYLLGLTYSEEKEHDKAIYYLNIAGQFAEKSPLEQVKRDYAYGMGMYYLHKNNGDSALYYFLPILKNVEENNSENLVQRYSAEIAQAWYSKGNMERTEFFSNKVLEGGRNVNTEHAFITCYHLLYMTSLNKNDFKNAVNYLNKYIQLKDSIINEKNLFELASLKTKYTLEKERQERDLLDAKKETQQLALLEKQRSLKNIFIACSVFFIIFGIFLYYANDQKKKKNKELAESIEKLRSTQEQLIHHEKLASMGRLSAGIAHEMRNPLNFVNNFSDMTVEMLDDLDGVNSEEERSVITQSIKNNIFKISQHGKRAEVILKQIVEHVDTRAGLRELNDVHYLCDTYLKIILHSMPDLREILHDKIVKDYDNHIPLISLNPQEIGRMLMNIYSNALQAIEEKLHIENYTPSLSIRTTFKNRSVNITIKDNGIGIKQEFLSKVSDPFFTTRPPGKGAGLGLSVAHDIIRSYGGSITVESEEMKFTMVRIEMPV